MTASRTIARAVPRLYVVTPPVGSPGAGSSSGVPQSPVPFSRSLAEALAGTGAAAVLLRLAEAGARDLVAAVKEIAPAVQNAGAAVLVEDQPDIAIRGGADGAHLGAPDLLKAALSRLKPNRIAGAGGLRTRHDAMTAAEAGADYVMFGEPNRAGARPAFGAVLERVAWWAELFEIPCVAYAGSLDEVAALAAAGADFVAVGGALLNDPRGLGAALAGAAARLAVTEAVP